MDEQDEAEEGDEGERHSTVVTTRRSPSSRTRGARTRSAGRPRASRFTLAGTPPPTSTAVTDERRRDGSTGRWSEDRPYAVSGHWFGRIDRAGDL
jgi:hypothetical protein